MTYRKLKIVLMGGALGFGALGALAEAAANASGVPSQSERVTSAVVSESSDARQPPARPEPVVHKLRSEQPEARERTTGDSSIGHATRSDSTLTGVAAPTPALEQERPIARCGNGLRLVASIYRPRHPERSLVALRQDGRVRMMARGQRVASLTVLDVGPTATLLRIGASPPCYLPVFLPASERRAANTPAKPAVAVKRATKGRVSADELRTSVRQLAPNRYALPRELLARILANPASFARSTRVIPKESHGRAIGMQVAVLGKHAPLALLGIQKGDVLRSLNGQSLASADGLLAALPIMRQQDRLTFSVLRANAPLNISVQVE